MGFVGQPKSLKAYFVPYLALSHIIPMVDLAKTFAARGVDVTLFLTHQNVVSFKKAIDEAVSLGYKLNVHLLKFPSKEVDLAEGVENINSTATMEVAGKLFKAFLMLQKPTEQVIRQNPPDFLVADMHCFWAPDIAKELSIPSFMYHMRAYFALCAEYNVLHYQPYKDLLTDDDVFEIPDFPCKITMRKSELPDWMRVPSGYTQFMHRLYESDRKSYGVIVNSFDELESEYGDHFKNVMGRKAWTIGPLCLSNKDNSVKEERGGKTAIDIHKCMGWLDSKEQKSVIYVSFGSLSNFSSAQLFELAEALGTCEHPFVWVVRKEGLAPPDKESKESLELKQFEEKVAQSDIGLIIRGWAPQMLILEHPAIGGFITHCGWNSVLESVAAGVPMITWPLSAEQFFNEKLVTRVVKIGVEIGVRKWSELIKESEGLVSREQIVRGIRKFMDGGEETKLMRERSMTMVHAASKAMVEGGSSYKNLGDLIDELSRIHQNENHAKFEKLLI